MRSCTIKNDTPRNTSLSIARLDDLVRDTRQALRALRRDVRFTVGVFGLLSLGIGANAAVFSIIDGVLIEPLPYSEPERLFVMRELTPARRCEPLGQRPALSRMATNLRLLRRHCARGIRLSHELDGPDARR